MFLAKLQEEKPRVGAGGLGEQQRKEEEMDTKIWPYAQTRGQHLEKKAHALV